MLAVSGLALWHGRRQPCPIDPAAVRTCLRPRRISAVLYRIAIASFTLGTFFAFVLPALLH